MMRFPVSKIPRQRSKKNRSKRKKGNNVSSGRKHRESSRSIKNKTIKNSSKLILSNNQIDSGVNMMKSPPGKEKSRPTGNILKKHKRQASMGIALKEWFLPENSSGMDTQTYDMSMARSQSTIHLLKQRGLEKMLGSDFESRGSHKLHKWSSRVKLFKGSNSSGLKTSRSNKRMSSPYKTNMEMLRIKKDLENEGKIKTRASKEWKREELSAKKKAVNSMCSQSSRV